MKFSKNVYVFVCHFDNNFTGIYKGTELVSLLSEMEYLKNLVEYSTEGLTLASAFLSDEEKEQVSTLIYQNLLIDAFNLICKFSCVKFAA